MKTLSLFERINIFTSSDFRDKLNEMVSAINSLIGRSQNGGASPSETITRSVVGIPVELTAVDGDEKWEFKEKIWVQSSESWEDVTSSPLTHTELGEIRPMGTSADDVPYAGTVGDIVYIYPKLIGDGGVAEYEFVPRQKKVFTAKVTASSSLSDDHSIEEVDGDGTAITNGFTSTTAKFLNGRRGVPTDTRVLAIVEDPSSVGGEPLVWLVVGEGRTGTPKDLTSVLTTADTSDWDVEDQGVNLGVEYQSFRAAVATPAVYMFGRTHVTDASGDNFTASAETRYVIEASADANSASGWITILPSSSGDVGGFIAHNEPGTDSNSVVLRPGTGITLNGSSGDQAIEVDQLGHALVAKAGADQVITIAATGGGGSGCTATYNVVTGSNGTSVTADDCSWELLFIEASHTGMILGVEANAVADAANDQAEVTLQANMADVNGYDGAKKQVLVNDSGTLKWVDTAECP